MKKAVVFVLVLVVSSFALSGIAGAVDIGPIRPTALSVSSGVLQR